jgi:hypothetical protein
MERTLRAISGCACVFSLVGCAASWPKAAEAPGRADQAEAFASVPAPGQPAAPAEAPAPMPAPSRAKTETAGASVSEKSHAPAELLAYEATVTLGVYGVEQAMATVVGLSRGLGGQLVVRNDDRVVFRVPRAEFDAALARIDGLGDVIHRDVHAEDVGDRYRDLEIRIRNARAVRDRLAELLARAATVDDSLKIEAQLGRVTEELELLRGEFEQLGSRVAFSKITVLFQARHTDVVLDEAMRLPFPWLKDLGLQKLLDLKE